MLRKIKLGCVQWCPVTDLETKGTKWNTGGSIWTPGYTSYCEGNWAGPQIAPERLCALSPWKYSEVIWTGSWATGSRWSWLNSGVDPHHLLRSHQITLSILFSPIISVSDVTKGKLRWKLRKPNLTDDDTTLVIFILTCKCQLIIWLINESVTKCLFIWKFCLALCTILVIVCYKVVSPDLSLICCYDF